MTFHFKHLFTSGKADGGDASLVRPSDWNADHAATADGPGVVGRTAGGSGPLSLLSDVSQFLPATALQPVGSMVGYAGAAAPTGWLLCDGTSYATATYPALFAVIAYTYGGAGANFNVPDMRGRVLAGLDNMGGAAASRLTNVTVAPNGNTRGAVGGQQAYTGALSGGSTTGSQSYSITTSVESAFGTGNVGGGVVFTYAANTHTHTASGNTGGEPLTVTGSTGVVSVQPTLLGNWIIKT